MDERISICKVKFNEFDILLKGTVKTVSWLAQALNQFVYLEANNHLYDNEISVKEVWSKCRDSPPSVFCALDDIFVEVAEALSCKNIFFGILPNLSDDLKKIYFCVDSKNQGVVKDVITERLKEYLFNIFNSITNLNKEILEIKEKLLFQSNDTLDIELANLEAAFEEAEKYNASYKHNGSFLPFLTFQDYLKLGAGTLLEKDPKKALNDYSKGVVICRKKSIESAFASVRSCFSIPENKNVYYLLDNSICVDRRFVVADGIVNSVFSFKTKYGEIYEYTDEGIDSAKWNDEVITNMLNILCVNPEGYVIEFLTKESRSLYVRSIL